MSMFKLNIIMCVCIIQNDYTVGYVHFDLTNTGDYNKIYTSITSIVSFVLNIAVKYITIVIS